MVFLEQSQQQHAPRDFREMLVDLHQLVAAHGEFLSKFVQQTLTEEAPDSPGERSPPHQPWNTRPPDQQPVTGPQRGWSLPLSVTTAPLGVKPEALPRLSLEPPRFDGENAPDWIRKIQTYYNQYYTPLDDRLYLTQYLFDHTASDWREYWEETNKGKGWEDFLVAVHHRFALVLIEDDASQVVDESHLVSSSSNMESTHIVTNGMSSCDQSLEANSKEAREAGDIVVNTIFDSGYIVVEAGDIVFNTAFESGQPAVAVAMEEITDVDSGDDSVLQGAARPIPGLPGDAMGLLDLYGGDARTILPRDELPNTLQIFVSTPNIVNLDLSIAKFSPVEVLYHWLYEIKDDGAIHNLLKFKADEEQVIEGMNKDMATMKMRLDIEWVREQIAMEARDNMKSHEDEYGKKEVSIKSPGNGNIFNGTEFPRMDRGSEFVEFNCRATHQFGDEIGVRIFDPGPFDVSKLIHYDTLEDLTAAFTIGIHNEGEHRAGTTGVAVEAKIWCHFRSAYFFFPP